MNIRHFLRWILLFVVLCTLTGCGEETARDKRESFGDFTCEVRGVHNGMEITARLKRVGGFTRVEYLSPQSICGITAEMQGNTCILQNGGQRMDAEETRISGFLLPVLLLTADHGTPKTVQKDHGNSILSYPDGVQLTLDADGIPLAYKNEKSQFQVVWWEWESGV